MPEKKTLKKARAAKRAGKAPTIQAGPFVEEEIEHVRFGWGWLCRLKPAGRSAWDAWCDHLHWPMRPAKAKGESFQRSARKAAGMTEEFLDRLEGAEIDSE